MQGKPEESSPKRGVTGRMEATIGPFTVKATGYTSSPSANLAIVTLEALPRTDETKALIEAQTYMGNLDVRALERLEAYLANPNATMPHEFDASLSRETIHRLVIYALEARRSSETAKKEDFKYWAGMVLTFVLGILSGWLLK